MAVVSDRQPRLSIIWPEARALRTQATSPQGATSQRLLASSTKVTGVESRLPVRRPRTETGFSPRR
jgi:hypothetical protein